MTPFKKDPPALIHYEPAITDPPTLQQTLTDRDCILQELKRNLLHAQEFMTKQAV